MVVRRWWLGGGRGCLGGEEKKKETLREGEGRGMLEILGLIWANLP